MLWGLCQGAGSIYEDWVDFYGGIVGILWRWGWQIEVLMVCSLR